MHQSLLAMQRSAGNAATAAWIQRLSSLQRHAEASVLTEPEPTATAGAGKAPAAAEPTQESREKAAKRFLEASDEGKEAIKTKDDYKVKVDWLYSGSGSFFDGGANSVSINKAENAPNSALVYVHEMNHAKYSHLGKTADVDKLDRAAYVKTMIDEEAEGTVKSIVAKIEMENGLEACLNASFVMEKEYAVAYKAATDELVKNNPKASAAEIAQAGRAAGLKRVNKGFYDGTIVTSTTGESYDVYYGKYWDQVHKPPAKK